MEAFKVVPDNAQHRGRRNEQQDAFGFSDPRDRARSHSGFLSIVADGMGGMDLGAESANLAVRTFLEAYAVKREDESIAEALKRSLLLANESVKRMADRAGKLGVAGTTLIAAVIHNNALQWVSVGDSHLYLVRDGEITQLNVDHNLKTRLERLVQKGHLTQEDVDDDPQKEALTSFIGIEDLIEVDSPVMAFPLTPGDIVVLCSDGLFKTLSEEEIVSIITQYKGWSGIASRLVEQAIARGNPHQDNVTVAALKCMQKDKKRNGLQDARIILHSEEECDKRIPVKTRVRSVQTMKGKPDVRRKILLFAAVALVLGMLIAVFLSRSNSENNTNRDKVFLQIPIHFADAKIVYELKREK